MPPLQSVAIIGCGPTALEAAVSLHVRSPSLKITVIESGACAGSGILENWPNVSLFSPWSLNVSPHGWSLVRGPDSPPPSSTDCPTGAEFVTSYLQPLAASLKEAGVEFIFGTKIVSIARSGRVSKKTMGADARTASPFRLYCESASIPTAFYLPFPPSFGFDLVLDASGVSSSNSYAGPSGLPALGEAALFSSSDPRISRSIPSPSLASTYAGKIACVVGSGYSAATSVAVLLAGGLETVYWVTRRERQDGVDLYPVVEGDVLKQREKLCGDSNKLIGGDDTRCRHLGGVVVVGVDGTSSAQQLTLAFDSLTESAAPAPLTVDLLLVNTGYRPNLQLFSELQVHLCYASDGPMKLAASLMGASGDCMAQPAAGVETLKNPEPNFFVLGSKSYGRNSAFLLRVGREQAEAVAGKVEQDLVNGR